MPNEEIGRTSSLREFLSPGNELVSLAYRLGVDKAVEVGEREVENEMRAGVRIRWERVEKQYHAQMNALVQNLHTSNLFTLVALSEAVAKGLKVYRPSALDCEVLENIEPAFPVEMYQQPYPVLVIELPPDYVESRQVEGVLATGDKAVQRPLAIFSYFHAELRVLSVNILMDRSQFLTVYLRLNRDAVGMTVQEALAKATSRIPTNEVARHLREQFGSDYENIFGCNAEERALQIRLANLAVCASMLFVNYGVKLHDPNPAHRKRLQEHIQKASKRGQQPNREVYLSRLAPRVLTIAQDIALYRRQGAARAEGAETGRKVKPHWRKGHLRNQKYGPGLGQTKLVFIQAVLVNEEDFAGQLGDTKVVYH